MQFSASLVCIPLVPPPFLFPSSLPTTELPPLPMRYFKKVFPAAEEMGEQGEPCVFQKHRRNNSRLTLEAFPHSFDVFSLVKIWEEKQNKSAAICRIRLEINHDFGVLQRRAGGEKKELFNIPGATPTSLSHFASERKKERGEKMLFRAADDADSSSSSCGRGLSIPFPPPPLCVCETRRRNRPNFLLPHLIVC